MTGLFSAVLLLLALGDPRPTFGQPDPKAVSETVTSANYFEKDADPKAATIKMYRYGNWLVDKAKWTAVDVVNIRVEPDPKDKTKWIDVLLTSRTLKCVPDATDAGKGYYGLKPGDAVPVGFTVDNLSNVSGTKTYWRAELYATPVGGKDKKVVAKSEVQELKIP